MDGSFPTSDVETASVAEKVDSVGRPERFVHRLELLGQRRRRDLARELDLLKLRH
jgi:hypothetical protein